MTTEEKLKRLDDLYAEVQDTIADIVSTDESMSMAIMCRVILSYRKAMKVIPDLRYTAITIDPSEDLNLATIQHGMRKLTSGRDNVYGATIYPLTAMNFDPVEVLVKPPKEDKEDAED